METKTCKKCSEDKPLSEFYLTKSRGKTYMRNVCKICLSAQARCWKKSNQKRWSDYCKSWVQNNKELHASIKRSWNKRNPDKVRTYSSNRRAQKARVSLSKSQQEEINYFYSLAKEAEILTGDKYEVDHIIPLKGKNVCGLHVPWNLQVLPQDLNRSKYNKVDGKYAAFSIGGAAIKEEYNA